MLTPLAVRASAGAEAIDVDFSFLCERLVACTLSGFFAVHRELGAGFSETIYQKALAHELVLRGLSLEHEVPFSVFYRGRKVGHCRADICVEGRLLVTVRSALSVQEIDVKVLENQLRFGALPVGLLLNFGTSPEFVRVSPVATGSSVSEGAGGPH